MYSGMFRRFYTNTVVYNNLCIMMFFLIFFIDHQLSKNLYLKYPYEQVYFHHAFQIRVSTQDLARRLLMVKAIVSKYYSSVRKYHFVCLPDI